MRTLRCTCHVALWHYPVVIVRVSHRIPQAHENFCEKFPGVPTHLPNFAYQVFYGDQDLRIEVTLHLPLKGNVPFHLPDDHVTVRNEPFTCVLHEHQ